MGKNKILEQPEDKDNTTDEEWYEEGVVLECHIDHYSNENGSIDEDDEYADIDAYRKAKGIEKILDPRRGIPLNTVAIGKTNIPGLENIDFVGRSSSVRKAMNDPTLDNDPEYVNRSIKAPYSPESWSFTKYAEEDLMAHFEKEIDERGLKPEEIEGTLFIYQSNYNGVCSACTAGVPIISNSTSEGIFMQLTKKYPKLKIVVTSDTRYGVPRGTGTLYFTLLDGKVTNWSKR